MRRAFTAVIASLGLTLAVACGGGGDLPVTPGPPPGPPPSPPPAVPSAVTVTGGVDQQAAPGTAVANAPTVTVTSASGAPVPNVAVVFSVDSGGGSITNPTATTNANGVASVGSWTLGASEGPQVLLATVGSLSAVKIRAMARFPTVVVATQTIGTSGGTITVNQPGSPLHGASIRIPDGAVTGATSITVSTASSAGIILRGRAAPEGPALVIAPVGGRLKKPAVLRMPASSAPGKTYMLAAYDPGTGGFTILPPLRRVGAVLSAVLPALDVSVVSQPRASAASGTTARVRAAQAAQSGMLLLTLQIPEEVLAGPFDSNFRALRDNWDFDRMAIAWLPFLAGQSEGDPATETIDIDFGMLATSLWYFEHQKSGGPLYGRFRKQADQAKSNVVGIRWAALANRDAPDQNAEVSESERQWLSEAPADIGRMSFLAIKALHWSSYERPVPVLLYSDLEGYANGVGVATRTLAENVIEIVVPENKESPYRMELTETGVKPFTVSNRNGSTYQVRAVMPQMHRLVVDGPGISSNWSRVVDGTIGNAEGWPEPELHWEKAKLDKSVPIILGDPLKHWWECPACPGLVTDLPDLAEASRPGMFQMNRIVGGTMPQFTDELRMQSAMRWSSDSVTSDIEPTTTGHVLYMPQAFVAAGSCEAPPRRWTRSRCGAELSLPERSGYVGGWLGWQTVQYYKVSLRPSPALVELNGTTTETFTLAPSRSLPTGSTFSWVLRTASGRDSVATAVPTHTRELPAGTEGKLLIMAHEAVTKRIIARDSVEVKRGAEPYWIINSIQDADSLFDADFPPFGALGDLLARPGSGLLLVEETANGSQLNVRVRKTGVWTPTDCCPLPPFNAALHHVLRLGVQPTTTNQLGPFFAEWQQNVWSQSTTDLGAGTMSGRYVDGTTTYTIKNMGVQLGPETALSFTATRNNKAMTGIISVTAWYTDVETNEVDSPPDTFRFIFTATRMK